MLKPTGITLFVVGLLSLGGCKDPYEPELHPGERSMLVVEGNLTVGDTTTFRLSRTVALSGGDTIKPEPGAVLTVEGRDNSVAPLRGAGRGFYQALLPALQVGKDYRLRIRTANGKEYLSDYVTVKPNPPIDSISWRQEADGVHIYTSTHDPNNNTHYYRWTYEETWEIRSNFHSTYKKGSPTTVVKRKMPEEDVSVCWKYNPSSSIYLASSARLSDDVIHEAPLIFIPNTHEKLGFRYSVLVRQYTLSKDAYEYLEILKKNSESLGSIFDAQPSEIRGNIRSVSDPNELVVGFVTASPVQERRIFISLVQLDNWGYYQFCEVDVVGNTAESIELYLGDDHPPIAPKYSDNDPGRIVGWFAADARCVDCTSRGGINQKPSFW